MDRWLQTLQTARARHPRVIAPWRNLLLALVFLLNLTSCTTQPRDAITLKFSTWGSAQEITVLKGLLHDFEATHPKVRIELLHIPENYYQKLHILIAGDLTPDIIFTNSLSFPIYADHGVFLDLQPYLKADAQLKTDTFYPSALQAFTWKSTDGSKTLGAIPRDISNLVVFYNKDWFKKAGIAEPKADWHWQDLVETGKALTEDSNNDGDPDRFGFSFYAKPPLFWLPFVWSAGGDLTDTSLKTLTIDQPAALQGLQFYANLRNKWHIAPKKVESGGATMSQLFLQEKIAMMVSGRWSVPVLREQAKFHWDVVPLPIGPSGQSRVGIDASGYAISAKTPYPKACWELVRFLSSRKAIEAVTASGLIVPARRDVAESGLFLEPSKPPTHGKAFLDVIPDGIPTHTPPRWNELSEALQLALEPVWDGTQTAQSAMQKAKPELQSLLDVGGGP